MQEKTFFLENEDTNKSQLIKWSIPKIGTSVNLQHLLQKVPDARKMIFKIYNPQKDKYVSFESINLHNQPYAISRDLLKLNVLMIRYAANPEYLDVSSPSQEEDQNKKQRSRERNIRQVIQLVQRWRSYHENPPDGKKKTLQQAAKYVGVSKKSLDDYYYQLRVGEKHEFDFSAHLEEKIGVLRAFIKQKQPERKIEGKNAKHPKKLKIIQQLTEKLRITDSNNSNEQAESQIQPKIQQERKPVEISLNQSISLPDIDQNLSNNFSNNMKDIFDQTDSQLLFWGAPFTPLSQQKFNDIEKNFYNDFDFMLEDPIDPYLAFTNMAKKKSNLSQNIG